MAASIPYNPFLTQNAAGLFAALSDGYVQGLAQDDPVYRNWLAGGVLAASETLPMWGGVAIYEDINYLNTPLANDSNPIGSIVGRALNVTAGAAGQYAGFSVFNQAYAGVITPSSPVPLVASGGPVNFMRSGSKARIPVQCAASLIALLQGASTLTQVSWDFNGQMLIPYQAAYGSASVQSATYNSGTGILALTFASAPAGATPTVGATFSVSGLAGTGSVASLNGDWPLASSASAGTVLNLQAPTGLGSITITGATGTLAAGGGALPCRVLNVQATGCKVVQYTASPQSAGWNNNGACALIEI